MSYWEYKETMENHDSRKGGGPGCAVMMLTLPFVMILGFVRERKEKKAETSQASQEDTGKAQAEHTENEEK